MSDNCEGPAGIMASHRPYRRERKGERIDPHEFFCGRCGQWLSPDDPSIAAAGGRAGVPVIRTGGGENGWQGVIIGRKRDG